MNIIKKIYEKFKTKLEVFGPFSLWLILGILVGIVSLELFVYISKHMLYNDVKQFDDMITGFVRNNISDKITTIMKIISDMASPTIIIILALILIFYFIYKNNKIYAALTPTVIVGSLLLNVSLKGIFHRQRPTITHLVDAMGLSYPSGHAMASFSFYGLLIYLVWKCIKIRWIKISLSIIFGTTIILIGISRIYLGVHFPSDVLTGFAAGSFWLVVCIYSFNIIRTKGGHQKTG